MTLSTVTAGANYRLYTSTAACTADNAFAAGTVATSGSADIANTAHVTVTSSAMTSGTTYVLGVRNIRDFWGNAVATTTCSAEFVYTAPAPKILSAVLSGTTPNATLLVTYDQAMTNSTQIRDNTRYTIGSCGGGITISASAATGSFVGTDKVLLTGVTTSGSGSGSCLLTVTPTTSITSTLGATLGASPSNTAYFAYNTSVTDSTPPVVLSVAPKAPNSSNTLEVIFNEPVSGVSAGDFSFSPALNVTGVSCTGNICTLTTADQSTTAYSMSVTGSAGGIQDASGNTLSSGTTTFTGDGKPYIVSVTALDAENVIVQWSETISAIQNGDYTTPNGISPAVNVNSVVFYPTPGTPSAYVKINISSITPLTSGTSYTFSLPASPATTDSSGNSAVTTTGGGISFTGPSTPVLPSISTVTELSPTTLRVTFTEPADNSTLIAANFTLGSTAGCPTPLGGNPSAVQQVSAGIVILTVSSGVGANPCDISVSNVKDLLGNTMAAANPTFTYTGTGGAGDTTAPSLLSVVSLSPTQIQAFFSEPMNTSGTVTIAMNNSANYSLSGGLTIGSLGTCTGSSCIINTSQQTAATYTLTVATGIQDTTGNATTSALTASFTGTPGSVAQPTLYLATLINSTTVELQFSEAMALTASQCATTGACSAKYTVTGGNQVSAAVRQADPTKVRLTLSPGAYGSANSYTVTGDMTVLTDVAGNLLTTPNTASFSGSSTSPSITDLAAGSDSGSSNSDNITGAGIFPSPGLVFSGTVAANTIVTLYDNGVPVATTVSSGTGSYSFTISSNPGDGSHNYTVATVGPTGLVSDASTPLTVTIDTAAPAQPTSLDLVAGSDSGISNTDNTTNSATPSFTVNCDVGSTVILRNGTTDITNPAGGVSCGASPVTITAATLSAGTYASINVVQVDTAGNTSTASTNLSPSLVVDTTGPTIAATSLTSNSYIELNFAPDAVYDNATSTGAALNAADFSIVYNDGGSGVAVTIGCVTNTASTTCPGTAPAVGATAVRVIFNVVGTPTGTESVTLNSVANSIYDAAGNAASFTTGVKTFTAGGIANISGIPTYTSTGTSTGYISLTWDEAAHSQTTGVGQPAPLVPGDFTVTFTQNGGNAAQAVVTSVTNNAGGALTGGELSIRIYVEARTGGGVATATSGVETLQVFVASNQIFSTTNLATPATENTGTFTLPDTLAPNAPTGLALAAADDSGSSNSDRITSQITALTISGTAEANSTVRLYQPNGSGTLLATTTANGSGNWSADISLAAGSTYTVVATARDAALNVSADSSSISITVDTSNPAATGTPDMTAATDSGSSNSDNTTSNTTPSFTISCETGASVQLYDGAVATGTAGACVAGSVTLTAATLGSGAHNINAIQTDPAGNASVASGNLSVTIDTTAPTAPGTPDLTAGTDSGSSNSDNVTNNTTPSFTVSCETGASVQLYDGVTATGTAGTCAGGTVTLTAGTLSAGVHASMNAIQTDPAGNTSSASGNLSVTIDNSAPAATGTPDMTAATDSGSSNSDDITSNTTPSFTVTCETGASVQLYDGAAATGTAVACAAGTATLTAAALGAGAHNMNAIQTDTAGNASTASSNLAITIDTSTPAATGTPDMTAATDTGSSNSDNITSNATPSFTVSCENGASVQLYDNLTATGTAGTCSGGTVTLTAATLSAGTHASINAIQTDAAGNASVASGNLSITIDTSTPAATGTPDMTNATDSGPSNTDNYTSNTTPAFTVSCENGASVQLYDGVTATGTAGTCAVGTVTLTAGTLTAGTHASINAIQTDAAGNTSTASSNLSITIDTSVAATGTPDMTAASDAGVSNTDNITNSTTPSFTVSCEDGASVQLYDNLTATGSAATCASGSATLTAATLTAGTHASMNAIQTDLAGNVSSASGNLSITIDTTAPTITSVSPAASANVNNTLVSFTFSEVCGTASITWTRTGGAADSNHTQSLTGSELNAGAHTNVTITNNPTLVDTSVYTVSWDCTDLAGNAATTVSSTAVTFNSVPIAITSAETMDTDNDGKIDTYRVAFNKNVNDSTFPGYSANALGSVTTNWLIAGYTNVRLIHGSAVTFATDTANDAVIYIRFDENALVCSAASQVGCDTAAKPDLTSTATPGLQDLGATTISQVNTASVTEADGAKPVLVAARSLSATTADAIFSETVETTTAQTATNYVITGGSSPSVSAANRDGTNTNIVHLTTGTQTGGVTYTLTVNTNVKDMANFNLNSSANTATFDGVVKPVVSSIVTTSATTLTITFNESVTAASTECANLSACSAIYTNTSLPVISAVSTAGAGNNSATYTLTVNPMVEGQSYTTTVTQDTVTSVATGQKMGSTNNSATFTGDGKPAVNISSDNATECPANGPQRRVVVQYDQSVLTGGGANAADNPANYSIPNTSTDTPQGCVDSAQPCGTGTNQTATSVTSYGGNKFGVNFGAAFDSDASQYVLKVVNVRDSNSNGVAVPTNLTFQCGNDTTAPSLIAVTVVSATSGSTVLLLTFSESVATVQANTTTNYRYDTALYGANVNTAAIQSNTAQVQVTFVPALSNGGHQLRTINQRDLAGTPNVILDNGVNNVQPFIVNAPTGFSGGPVFTDPFADGTPAGQMVIYDNKVILGWDTASSKFFEMDKGLTTAQTITLDADGTATAPYTQFASYASSSSGTLQGIDAISAGCVGGTSTPSMTGTACTAASGTEYILVGGFNTSGTYRSVFRSTDKSSNAPRFTFTERGNLDASGNTYRSMTAVIFKNYLFVASPHIGSFAPRTSRVCALPSGACGNGETSWNTPTAIEGRYFPTIGKGANAPNSTGDSNPTGNAVAIDTMYEHDTDGTGGTSCSGASCPSQLYMANGGRFFGTLAANTARTSTTRYDGGVLRSHPSYSTAAAPPGCDGVNAATCESARFENITPSSSDWKDYMSIALPYLTIAGADWANMLPSNRIIPAMKAVPYMRAAPNGDLYMIRNACATIQMQTVCMNGGSCNGGSSAATANSYTVAQVVNNNFTADFSTTATGRRQTCPPGYEVPQLWVLPKSTGGTRNGSAEWQLVASRTFTPQTYPNGSALPSRKSTTLSGNTTTCGTAPNNKCERNAQLTLLEFVGNYLYLGFDNQDHGANIWRVDMNSATCTGSASCAISGNYPAEASFTIVNDVLGLDGSATNQRIFSHLTVNDSGKDWLILATRDGTNSMKIYRTANDQN